MCRRSMNPAKADWQSAPPWTGRRSLETLREQRQAILVVRGSLICSICRQAEAPAEACTHRGTGRVVRRAGQQRWALVWVPSARRAMSQLIRACSTRYQRAPRSSLIWVSWAWKSISVSTARACTRSYVICQQLALLLAGKRDQSPGSAPRFAFPVRRNFQDASNSPKS